MKPIAHSRHTKYVYMNRLKQDVCCHCSSTLILNVPLGGFRETGRT